tara:strand:- start:3175 stop:3618 length:444 start_codon:yes stop_codon:yes gene_type:complete
MAGSVALGQGATDKILSAEHGRQPQSAQIRALILRHLPLNIDETAAPPRGANVLREVAMATAQLITTPMFLANIGPAGLILIAVVVLVLFGRGKVASLMGEVGKGITAFKRGVNDSAREIEDQAETTATDATDAARDVTPSNNRDNS